LQFVRRYRIPALSCAFAVLLCELIARPYANMGVCDDGPYILVAQHLAATGHVVYNGWSAAMLLWQLCLGAAFIKLFGFSFTTVRMSTLLVAIALAFVLQRALVLAGATERNSTIGTLALVLSPLYLELSVTFMSDIHGLFAIVLCLYGCLRALRSSSARSAIAWLCFAVATNVVCGTSRQLAWLGTLVMVPCTLWLLRTRRRTFIGGVAVALTGVFSILVCLHWLALQPYTTPESFVIGSFPVLHTVHEFISFFLDFPFFLLPVVVLFLPQARKRGLGVAALIVLVGYILLAVYSSHLRDHTAILEPTFSDWVTRFGEFDGAVLKGLPPVFLNRAVRGLLTLASIGGMFGLTASFFNPPQPQQTSQAQPELSWKSLSILLAPFTFAYILLLVYRAITIANAGTPEVLDRYSLGLLVVAVLVLVRYYQDHIDFRLPVAGFLFIAIMAVYGVAVTHNTFALYRARVALAAELRAAGVPDTSVDNGWEYNVDVELDHADHVNNPGIVVPAHAYAPISPPPTGTCEMVWYNYTPHIHPLYGVSFDANACRGPAPFAAVHYSRWLVSQPVALYVVRYTAEPKP
jgi:hypothetical protein